MAKPEITRLEIETCCSFFLTQRQNIFRRTSQIWPPLLLDNGNPLLNNGNKQQSTTAEKSTEKNKKGENKEKDNCKQIENNIF